MAQDTDVLVVDLDGRPGAAGRSDAEPAARGAAPRRPRRADGRAWPPRWPHGTPAWARGPLGAVAAAVLALAVGAPIAVARAGALEADRDRGRADVAVGGGALVTVRAPSSYDYNTRALLELHLVNTGSAPVTLLDVRLTGAAAGFDDDLEAGVEVAPSTSAAVLLSGPVPCLDDVELAPGAPTAVVRSADGTEHVLDLPEPDAVSWLSSLRRACDLGGRS